MGRIRKKRWGRGKGEGVGKGKRWERERSGEGEEVWCEEGKTRGNWERERGRGMDNGQWAGDFLHVALVDRDITNI